MSHDFAYRDCAERRTICRPALRWHRTTCRASLSNDHCREKLWLGGQGGSELPLCGGAEGAGSKSAAGKGARQLKRMGSSMKRYKVAIAGATGAVGREMMKVLGEREFPVSELVPLASERSEGQKLEWQNREVVVRRLKPD